jgi:hypothetical protein
MEISRGKPVKPRSPVAIYAHPHEGFDAGGVARALLDVRADRALYLERGGLAVETRIVFISPLVAPARAQMMDLFLVKRR